MKNIENIAKFSGFHDQYHPVLPETTAKLGEFYDPNHPDLPQTNPLGEKYI
jgi:hypothetical protein